ncbi:MAG: hypothetical protein ACFCU3_00255 [Verrucomicrobiales bacterium]
MAGRTTSVVDALGNETAYAYDYPSTGGVITTIT